MTKLERYQRLVTKIHDEKIKEFFHELIWPNFELISEQRFELMELFSKIPYIELVENTTYLDLFSLMPMAWLLKYNDLDFVEVIRWYFPPLKTMENRGTWREMTGIQRRVVEIILNKYRL